MTKLSIHTIVAALCGSFFLTACPGDDTTSTGTETEGESTSTGPTVTTMPPPTTTPPGTDSTTAEETTVAVDDTSSTGPEGTSSTGPDDTSSTGPDDTSSSGGSSSSEGGSSSSEGGSESSTTGDPPPMDGYGDCANNDPAVVCLPDEVCLYAGMDAACFEQGCADAGDCAVPATGTATPACLDLSMDGITDCYLDCAGGETCPDGMICVFDQACVWPYVEVPPPMGICPDQDLGNAVPQTVMGDNTGLGDDWEPSCAPGGEDSTYLFTAPAAGSYTFDTVGSALADTVVAVLDDCAGPELGCNDDVMGGVFTSEVTVALAAGQTVIVVVEGYGGDAGPFTLNISN